MQDIVITVVKKIKTAFEKFDDFVYVHYEKDINGQKRDAFMISRKDFDYYEKQHGKNYQWILSYPMKKRYYACTQEYLKHYFEGNWHLFHESFIEKNPLPLLRAGDTSRFFHGSVMEDGYLRSDNKRVRRAWNISFTSDRYCRLLALREYLINHPKVKRVIVENGRLEITYVPSIPEFNKLVANKDTFTSWDVEESARKSLRIPKGFKRTEDDFEDEDF